MNALLLEMFEVRSKDQLKCEPVDRFKTQLNSEPFPPRLSIEVDARQLGQTHTVPLDELSDPCVFEVWNEAEREQLGEVALWNVDQGQFPVIDERCAVTAKAGVASVEIVMEDVRGSSSCTGYHASRVSSQDENCPNRIRPGAHRRHRRAGVGGPFEPGPDG